MKTFLINVGHAVLSIIIVAISYALTQNYAWLGFTMGTVLLAIQHWAAGEVAIQGAIKRGNIR